MIPEWAWAVAGALILLLLSVIKVLVSREVKRNDDLHGLVTDHIRKEEAVWIEIKNISELTKGMDTRIDHLENLANGNVAALTSAIGVMTQTLSEVLERRSTPRV